MVVLHPGDKLESAQGAHELAKVVATQEYRLDFHRPLANGKGFRERPSGSIDTTESASLGEQWKTDLATGGSFLTKQTWLHPSDRHLDAKCWPVAHPHGTGSVFSEVGSGGLQRHARNRLFSTFSWFRRSAMWCYWMLDRLQKPILLE